MTVDSWKWTKVNQPFTNTADAVREGVATALAPPIAITPVLPVTQVTTVIAIITVITVTTQAVIMEVAITIVIVVTTQVVTTTIPGQNTTQPICIREILKPLMIRSGLKQTILVRYGLALEEMNITATMIPSHKLLTTFVMPCPKSRTILMMRVASRVELLWG